MPSIHKEESSYQMAKVLTVTLHPALDRFLMIPRLVPWKPSSAQAINIYGGGKGINAARTLYTLGAGVLAAGFQGGATGQICIESLEREGIPTAFVPCLQPTRVTTVLVEATSGNLYPLYEPRQAVSQAEVHNLLNHFKYAVRDVDLCLLCGAGDGPASSVYADMILMAAAENVRCFLDSSGDSLRNGIKAQPYMVKINLEELSHLAGRPLSSVDEQLEALKDLMRQGVKVAAVSNGEQGLIAIDGNECYQGQLSLSRARNTVGCGDAMLAGMAFAFLQGLPLADLVRWGVACGSENTLHFKAGQVDPRHVKSLVSEVEVRLI
jgi:1-phosphofructokinase family hexose kinase